MRAFSYSQFFFYQLLILLSYNQEIINFVCFDFQKRHLFQKTYLLAVFPTEMVCAANIFRNICYSGLLSAIKGKIYFYLLTVKLSGNPMIPLHSLQVEVQIF